MHKLNKDWYEAIFIRHSRRKFSETPIEAEKLQRLEELIGEVNESTNAARARDEIAMRPPGGRVGRGPACGRAGWYMPILTL